MAVSPNNNVGGTYTWPELHGDPLLSGVSDDPAVADTAAATLGVNWMVNTGSQNLGSPVGAYDAALGKTLVFQTTAAGDVLAMDEATGAIVWSTALNSPVRASPLVYQGAVWIATTTSKLFYKLSENTGATECSIPVAEPVDSSAVGGVPGSGLPTVYVGTNDYQSTSGPMYSVNTADCHVNYTSTPFPQGDITGEWDPIAFTATASGEPLVVWGTADPDSAVYAINANTGAEVWRFATYNPGGDSDVGSGVTISPPGVNGFADGVAYVPGKDGHIYALDLATGALVWDVNFGARSNVKSPGSTSTPCLLGDQLLLATNFGLLDLNATTGAQTWLSPDSNATVASPLVTGPAGHKVAVYGDLTGVMRVVRISDGATLYSYQTHNYIAGSPADVNGHILQSSADGFLYDFSVGGSNGAAPTTSVTSPATQTSVANPNGSLAISGTATGTTIGAVALAIQENGTAGDWWNGASGRWQPGYALTSAVVGTPSGGSTPWSYALPVALSGASLQVFATATGTDDIADTSSDGAGPSASRSTFIVQTSPSAPQQMTASTYFVAPASSLTAAGTGFGAGETVSFSLNGTTLGTAVASSSGAVAPTKLTVPPKASFGPSALLSSGATSGDSALAQIYVTNAAAQADGGATHSSYEPNDYGPVQEVTAQQTAFLGRDWSATTTAVPTAPAVVDGVAYIGTSSGHVSAVRVRDGSASWSVSVGGDVGATPAVDPTGDVVAVTDGSPAVQALHVTSGAARWSFTAAAPVSAAPAIAGGKVFVTATDGSVYELVEATGRLVWRSQPASGSLSAPAVDITARVLSVGTSTGGVLGLSTATGATLWSFASGHAATPAPAISGGSVFATAGAVVYALRESTGVEQWSWTSPATLAASLVASPVNIIVGDADGNVTWLTPATGAINYQFTVSDGAVVSLFQCSGFAMVTTTQGYAWGLKTNGSNASWKYQSAAGLSAAPVVNNGIVYLAGEDDTVQAFSVPGVMPS